MDHFASLVEFASSIRLEIASFIGLDRFSDKLIFALCAAMAFEIAMVAFNICCILIQLAFVRETIPPFILIGTTF